MVLAPMLNRASRSRRTRRAVESFPATRRVVTRFVAGETVPDAVSTTESIVALGRQVTIDVLGEDVTDLAGARRTRDAYIALLNSLHENGLAKGADVSLKLSALGQALSVSGETIATKHARDICVAADAVQSTVTFDMENHATVDSTLSIGSDLRREFPWLGTVLQSNLKRTDGDIRDLATSSARIRIVKGTYREPAHVAHMQKAEVDVAFRRHIDALMKSTCYPMVATHDPEMLEHAQESARQHGLPPTEWECQLLFGIRKDLQEELVDEGHVVRVYVPFGTDWYGYFMRRLAERPANVAFFLRALASR